MRLSAFISPVLLAAASAFSTHASAQGSVYTQFSAGVNLKTNLRTQEIIYTDGVDTLEGVFSTSSKPRFAAGLEVGGDGIAGRIRIAAAYDYIKFGADTIGFEGEFNGTDVDGTIEADDYDLDLVSSLHAIQGMAAVNVLPRTSKVRAFLGGGGGIALSEDTDMGYLMSGTASIEFPMGQGFYGGLRYRYYRVTDLTDEALGVNYETANLHLMSFTLSLASQ